MNAAADAKKNYNFANQKKLEQLHADTTMQGTVMGMGMQP